MEDSDENREASAALRSPDSILVFLLHVLTGCHRSRYSETCAFPVGQKTQVTEYADL